ncbi:MAG: hypothetical protein AAFW47_01150 [Pseudomonadota bacterium]
MFLLTLQPILFGLMLSVPLILTFGTVNASAIDTLYVSSRGAGLEDGSSKRNALPVRRLSRTLEAQSGDLRVLFARGTHRIKHAIVIPPERAGFRTILEGVGRATIDGGERHLSRNARPRTTAIELGTGNVEVRNLTFINVGHCIRARQMADVNDVAIEAITAKNVHMCIVASPRPGKTAHNWSVNRLKIRGYSKAGLRFAGKGARNIKLTNLSLDGKGGAQETVCHVGGIQLKAGVQNVQVSDARIRNNVGHCGSKYQQGDGIEVDDKKGVPRNLSFNRIRIQNSADGGFDLKGKNIKLTDVRVTDGRAQKYAFRFWNYDTYECTGCRARGAKVATVFMRDSRVLFKASSLSKKRGTPFCKAEGKGPSELIERAGSTLKRKTGCRKK